MKANQPKLKAALEETVIVTEPVAYYIEESLKRGRLEIRETWLYRRQDNMEEGRESIRLIAFVRRDFLSKKKEHKTESFMSRIC